MGAVFCSNPRTGSGPASNLRTGRNRGEPRRRARTRPTPEACHAGTPFETMPSKRTILTTLTTRELRTAIDDYELHVDDRLTGPRDLRANRALEPRGIEEAMFSASEAIQFLMVGSIKIRGVKRGGRPPSESRKGTRGRLFDVRPSMSVTLTPRILMLPRACSTAPASRLAPPSIRGSSRNSSAGSTVVITVSQHCEVVGD